ncbi:MAG: UDP-2,4-diacetamido-2,4,6-trideoxy-beta-L-altropyranose hydrolase [Bacteroidota bacterium]
MEHKIIFRVDGNHQIGLGHLVRCIALAHMLKNDFPITFYCNDIPDNVEHEILKIGFSIIKIKEEVDFLNSIASGQIVILDGYHFNSAFQKQIKEKNAKLVCIDDIQDKEFFADLIINHAPGVKSEDYKAKSYTQFAIGPDYALLRPAFLEQAKKEREIEKIETVLICFGGSDYKNLTESALKIVQGFSLFKKIIIVTGSTYINIDSLRFLIDNNQKIFYYHSVDENSMLSLMIECDLAIVPASGILMEAIAAGCNVISGIYAENQKYVYSNYKISDSFIDAHDFNEIDLIIAIKKAFNEDNRKMKIIDGNSAKRLLKIFFQLDIMDKIELRIVNQTDVEVTYLWSTNPVVRAFSFNQHKITVKEHTAWFYSKVEDCNCLYLIAEMDKYKVGSIRFDVDKEEAIISYLIDPKFYGMGLGQIVLIKGIEHLRSFTKKKKLTFIRVVGYVMKTNIPSIKVFERTGFTKHYEEDKLKFEKTIYLTNNL